MKYAYIILYISISILICIGKTCFNVFSFDDIDKCYIEAKNYQNKRKFDKAIEIYKRCANLDVENSSLHAYELGKLYELGSRDGLIFFFETIRKDYKKACYWYKNGLLNEQKYFIQEGKCKQAYKKLCK